MSTTNTELIARLKDADAEAVMTTPLCEDAADAIEALESQRDDLRSQVGSLNAGFNNCQKEHDALQAQLAAAQGQSPFAWAYQCSADRSGPVFSKTKNNWADSGTGLWTETPLYAAPIPQQPAEAATDLIDILCARIKAADDAMADNDYMLDSDDCIAVIRGTWKPPLLNDKPVAPQPKEMK